MELALDVGCGHKLDVNRVRDFKWVGLDKYDFSHLYLEGQFVQHDLKDPLPYPDRSVGMIWCHHVLEHLPPRHPTIDIDYVVWVINEFHRVLKTDAQCHLIVPWREHKNSWADPAHYRHFALETFHWFVATNLDASRASTGVCGQWHKMQNVIMDECHVYAILTPIKP